jgi:phage tail sheath protein FI
MEPIVTQGTAPEHLLLTKAPGVYEEKSFGVPHRAPFSTGVPVFFGTMSSASQEIQAEKIPKPHMLSLWSQFSRHIGEPYGGCHLAAAVRGFFDNGGHWCYVVVLKDRSTRSLHAGLEATESLRTVDLVCTPDLDTSTAEASLDQQQIIVDYCDRMGDRFALLDSRQGDTLDTVWKQWSATDGRNGALYYPWLWVNSFKSGLELVPPCGHIAGVISRTDRDRGVHKAPANESLAGVIDLEQRLTQREQDFLNPCSVNCIRSFAKKGICVWGARTISGSAQWRYINVRRLFLTATRWIEWSITPMLFEPNDAPLWAHIQRTLTEYFAGYYRAGALKGDTLQAAFYVKCDGETNTRESRELGQVVTEIGLAPLAPYEFVVVRLIYGSRGAHS